MIFDLYDGKSRIPTKSELVKSNINSEPFEIKHIISKNTLFIPLYDVFTTNIYIIQKRNPNAGYASKRDCANIASHTKLKKDIANI